MQTQIKSNFQFPVQDNTNTGIYRKYVKRLLDILISLLAIIILLPVLFIITVAVRVKIGSPVLFMQERPGLNEKVFTLYKFRTMTNERDDSGELLPNHIRLTKFGRLLRLTSCDELPELFNILKGDMSLIGPRPLLIEYLPLYNKEQKRRHCVRPGLSGLAQVNGRNAISWEEKFNYDIEYVENLSFLLDLKIMAKTIFKVFTREGVNKTESLIVERFRGTNNYTNI